MQAARLLEPRDISVYVGIPFCGTPTTTACQLNRPLDLIDRSLDLTGRLEYTVEAGRPDTITQEKLQVLARHGVGRVSINPQSMDDRVLALCGRRHKAAQIPEGFRMA